MLSEGFVETLTSGENVDENLKPVLQVLGSKKIPTGPVERYRLLLSDGIHSYPYFLLAIQLNDKLLAGELDPFTVIRLEHYVSGPIVKDRRMMIVLNFSVLRPGSEIRRLSSSPTPTPTQPVQYPINVHSGTIHQGTPDLSTRNNNKLVVDINGSKTPPQQNQQHDLPTMPIVNLATRRMSRIESLSPYRSPGAWTIRARVMHKTGIKKYANSRNCGQVFSVELADETSEIRAVGWNELADRFHETFQINKVYYVANGSVNVANKTYSDVKHDFELLLRNNTVVQVCEQDCFEIPLVTYSFVPIAELENAFKDSVVDVVGICTSAANVETITSSKNRKQYIKRDITLADQTKRSVKVTLWSEEAEQFDGIGHPVALYRAKVTNFNGIGLGAAVSTIITCNPDIAETGALREWFAQEGKDANIQSIGANGIGSKWSTLGHVQNNKLGMEMKPDYFTCKATVILMKKENCLYQACPTMNCRKKVTSAGNDLYYCEKCNKNSNSFKWCLILTCLLSDFSDNLWVTCFQESAEIILGKSSEEMGRLQEADDEAFQQVFLSANFQTFVFNLRRKAELFNDELKVKTQITSVFPLSYHTYCRKLLNEIGDYCV